LSAALLQIQYWQWFRGADNPKSADNSCRRLVKFDPVDSSAGAGADNSGKKMSAFLGVVGTHHYDNRIYKY